MSMWSEHQDCLRLVTEVWSRKVDGCPMSVLAQKLKNLKKELKVWNKDVFGDINERVKMAQIEVDAI